MKQLIRHSHMSKKILFILLFFIGVVLWKKLMVSNEENHTTTLQNKTEDLQKPPEIQPEMKYDALQKQPDSTLMISGAELYKQNCAACHGLNKKGNPPSIPSLSDIGKRMSEQDILNLLSKGRNGMPSFAHLPLEQRKAIVDFLLGKKSEIKIKPLTEIEKGKQIFISRCSMCHQAVPSDPEPAGRKNYGPVPAVLGGIDKVMSFRRFEHMLNRGPAYMPSFQEMSLEDQKAVYHYLSTLPYTRRPTRRCGGGRCGMSKCGR